MDDLEQTIHDVVQQVVEQRGGEIVAITNQQRLAGDLGLRSLDLAQLVALLEINTGVDPFAAHVAITDVRTVGDLCDAYRVALGLQPSQPGFGLQAGQARAEARRRAQGRAAQAPQTSASEPQDD